ncbi:MAG: 3-oxoacyl-(acyl-carrier-protein) reductase FabG [Actinobacteria bacterium ADurb.Bin346]|nr:MAG: 3-oxoacyl-(acyl-carrier-protein) reductase FabG [Actinobacteria bacterium ADurb.Bin346]
MLNNEILKEKDIKIAQNRQVSTYKNDIQATLADSASLYGKKTIITGAASGIGKSISIRFAEAGSELILIDKDKKGLEDLSDKLSKSGRINSIYNIDLSDKENIDKFWNSLEQRCPDILINNAGIYPFMDYLKVDRAFYEKTLEINLNSVFWMCQNFIRLRGNSGGVIVNTSSIEAVTPFKEDLAHYSVSKSGVIALTKSLARDYGRKGFRVNAVLPGAIKTPGTENLIKKAIRGLQFKLIKTALDFNSRLTLGRWGNPDEVAKVVLFLSCDLSSYVQGAVIPVDGGFLSS